MYPCPCFPEPPDFEESRIIREASLGVGNPWVVELADGVGVLGANPL